jgi:ABC-type multidrug transport system fused ATPase/permease subunit
MRMRPEDGKDPLTAVQRRTGCSAGPLRLEFDAVDFAYDDEPVLTGVTLDLAPGETLCLVGRTGSGKTTIARLVARLYGPAAGSVRVGGPDLSEADPMAIRRRIGVVTQDVQPRLAVPRGPDRRRVRRQDH